MRRAVFIFHNGTKKCKRQNMYHTLGTYIPFDNYFLFAELSWPLTPGLWTVSIVQENLDQGNSQETLKFTKRQKEVRQKKLVWCKFRLRTLKATLRTLLLLHNQRNKRKKQHFEHYFYFTTNVTNENKSGKRPKKYKMSLWFNFAGKFLK